MNHDDIASFNRELVSFDPEKLSLDVLEHRFELTTAAVSAAEPSSSAAI